MSWKHLYLFIPRGIFDNLFMRSVIVPLNFFSLFQNLRPAIPGDCPPAMAALIEQCWSLQPDKRPEFWHIVKVLEQFETSLACNGTLSLVQNPICQDHKKGLLHWIQKLGPMHPHSSPIPKPKFT